MIVDRQERGQSKWGDDMQQRAPGRDSNLGLLRLGTTDVGHLLNQLSYMAPCNLGFNALKKKNNFVLFIERDLETTCNIILSLLLYYYEKLIGSSLINMDDFQLQGASSKSTGNQVFPLSLSSCRPKENEQI